MGLQTTAPGPNPARQAISSGPRRQFVNNVKRINLQKLIDLATCNISRNKDKDSKMSGPRIIV